MKKPANLDQHQTSQYTIALKFKCFGNNQNRPMTPAV